MLRQFSTEILLGIFVIAVIGSVGLFVVDVRAASPEPVAFDDTVSVGLTLESEYSLGEDVDLPKAQVFYSRYEYVVGYYGVESFAADRQQDGHTQQFGHPLTVYVTDYSGSDVELSRENYPVTNRTTGWTNAETAWFVVGSSARTPRGSAVMTFSKQADAKDFIDEYGGSIRRWDSVLRQSVDRDSSEAGKIRVNEMRRVADERVSTVTPYSERQSSLVVGEDAATIQEAIREAPAGTTIIVPEGEYRERVEIDRPLTIEGRGNVTINGGGNGSVITVTADRVAIKDVTITGVGNVTREGGELPVDIDEDAWDASFTKYYAGTDAGIAAYMAAGLNVQNVSIETPASGVIAYESNNTVIQNASISVAGEQTDGLAGILLFRSPGVVADSTVVGGRNGVYLYRSSTTIVRRNEIRDNFLGIHLMYTSGSLVAENDLARQGNLGITIMTGPQRNALVGNEVRDASDCLSVGGSATYVADNLVEGCDYGIRILTRGSTYEGNVVAGSRIGAETSAMLPTNRVVANDFVGNDQHATGMAGPLRIWSHDSRGNYWQGTAAGATGPEADLSYSPAGPIDGRLHEVRGTQTLARSPAMKVLDGFAGSVPGMRTGSLVDRSPACSPYNPRLLAQTEWAAQAWTCSATTHIDND